MSWIIVILILGAAGMVVFSLVRGLIFFARTGAAIQQDSEAAHELYLAQNRMMFARVKWQAITIVLLLLFGVLAAAGSGN